MTPIARIKACLLVGFLWLVPAGVPTASSSAPGAVQDFVPAGKFGRRIYRPMRPTYITIHSTENRARSADARRHAEGMRNGAFRGRHNAIGYLAWHFTVDDHSIYQSLPTNIRGEHADYDGPGNRTSIGIEMCQNRGNNHAATIDRTARLTAWLMREYGIPIRHVVPHMHWRMIRHSDHKDLGYKKCPEILLDRGQLGARWSAFLRKVEKYRRAL